MNFRPWYKRLVLSPFSFIYEVLMFAYEKYTFTNPTLLFGNRVVNPELRFDAVQGRLNGVPFGAAVDSLAPFGAADHALSSNERDFCLEYSCLGLNVCFKEQRLVSFEINFDSTGGGGHPIRFVPCMSAEIKIDEVRTVDVRHSSTPDDLSRLLGEPDLVETGNYEFGIEKVLFYHLPACRIVASFDAKSDKLIHLDLSPKRA